jgi:hypothetical protein
MGHAWFCGVKKQGGRKSGRGKGKSLSRDRKNPDVAGKIAVGSQGKSRRGSENCRLETRKIRTAQGKLLFRDRENPHGAKENCC